RTYPLSISYSRPPPRPRPQPFPYTTLFRSLERRVADDRYGSCWQGNTVGKPNRIVSQGHREAGQRAGFEVGADRPRPRSFRVDRSEEHTSELQSRENLVCRLLLEKKKKRTR